jgi:hypothetical protein
MLSTNSFIYSGSFLDTLLYTNLLPYFWLLTIHLGWRIIQSEFGETNLDFSTSFRIARSATRIDAQELQRPIYEGHSMKSSAECAQKKVNCEHLNMESIHDDNHGCLRLSSAASLFCGSYART